MGAVRNTESMTSYDLHETQELLTRKQFIIANQPHLITSAATPLQNFNTDVPAALKKCTISLLPLQPGTGEPNPTNVRPISGRTSLELYRTGKNLLNPALCLTTTYWADDGTRKATSGWYSVDPIPVIAGRTYKLTGSTVTSATPAARHLFFAADGQTIVDMIYAGNTNFTFTAPVNAYYVGLSIKASSTDGLCFAENTNETYNGVSVPVTFSSEAGTVYGGTIDLITGQLTVTMKQYVLNNAANESWGTNGFYTNRYRYSTYKYSDLEYGSKITSVIACNYALPTPNGTSASYSGAADWITNIGTYGPQLFICTGSISDVASFKSYIQEHPIYLIIKLQTPITYTLTPQTIKTLRGVNNIWSNDYNSNIEISYWSH